MLVLIQRPATPVLPVLMQRPAQQRMNCRVLWNLKRAPPQPRVAHWEQQHLHAQHLHALVAADLGVTLTLTLGISNEGGLPPPYKPNLSRILS